MHCLGFQLQQNDILRWDDDEVDAVRALPPPKTLLNITSDSVLPITVSIPFLEATSNLAKVIQSFFFQPFSDAEVMAAMKGFVEL